jgi:hypothetical protein
MAVSIDRVYQKVLALANKEQRGYITPQEFNLFADQAQKEIFEQYFYDLNQFKRVPGNSSARHDVVNMLKEKTQIFNVNSAVVVHGSNISPNTYRVGDCWATTTNNHSDGSAKRVEQIDVEDIVVSQSGPLTRATNNRPIFYLHHNQIYFQPQSILNTTYRLNTIRKPEKPNWTYIIGSNQNALFNPDPNAGWQDFELHASEESKLVIKILQLAGVGIKDLNLAQLAGQKEASVKQQEKQ